MYFSNDRLYTQTKALQRGELILSAVHRKFLARLRAEFGIEALNAGLDTYSKRQFGQQFLEIVVARLCDAQQLYYRKDKPAIPPRFTARWSHAQTCVCRLAAHKHPSRV